MKNTTCPLRVVRIDNFVIDAEQKRTNKIHVERTPKSTIPKTKDTQQQISPEINSKPSLYKLP
ncbi:33010_t:CDS:1, partial [Racocetra persica]